MSSQTQSSAVLLQRVLSLKEASPLILVLDTIFQSSHTLLSEINHRISTSHPANTVNKQFFSFETTALSPGLSDFEFHDVSCLCIKQVIELISSKINPSVKNLILIDSINYVENVHLSKFINEIIQSENITILTTYHTSLPEFENNYQSNQQGVYPSSYSLLTFIASTILEILPHTPNTHMQDDEESLLKDRTLLQSKGYNNTDFITLHLTNKRKSGRSVNYPFTLNLRNHEAYPLVKQQTPTESDEDLLKGLTTFNLTTSAKQKIVKDQVELPYFQAQELMGEAAGAIVYQYEKDDDYDEEDPYEDPF
ncbi:hypothetical protein WICPIJ_003065 [Wickerhamomyces pijperi]|uniref:Elongator complex protein 5 n=1 Tax=Wickerhamomyces pijperi TaxID=599730 RepID=A0A9P8Q7Z1_WICPI|nr:hypothetical protein WICPIJ_003065 [Wickerhamomyces pijperi]